MYKLTIYKLCNKMENEKIKELIIEACDQCNKRMGNNCILREYGDFCTPITFLLQKLENELHISNK